MWILSFKTATSVNIPAATKIEKKTAVGAVDQFPEVALS